MRLTVPQTTWINEFALIAKEVNREMVEMTKMQELMNDAYPDVELDEPTEEDWDNHALAHLEEMNLDCFASQPESEI
jgi:DNA-directed RNA polymerase sigma subunit (sigma70/sigma32)